MFAASQPCSLVKVNDNVCMMNDVELVADVATDFQSFKHYQMVKCLLLEANRLRCVMEMFDVICYIVTSVNVERM